MTGQPRYKALPLDLDEGHWRVFDMAARTPRGTTGRFTGRRYRGPFARARCFRRARKLSEAAGRRR